ncbi:TetR/AcrR family transcriptional regulator [Nonomuraea rhodomycinica]|uniref:TetR family transcriptional regulator n=1 Tax=Nonomuraea rhodomycinica TaxID=1712872 RepID=A0A7Y6IXI3_9ACTN|nr:TetR family transcriptional regulator [Nonomuraea rhodomycinica]NUW46226.1 TetR family transcriptional regulator [Nonomuraea rhodomycinica]
MRSRESAALSRTRRARREDLIAAAIQVISQDGYGAASLERIAREAGTSKGNALYHFSSKEELYQAVATTLFETGAAYMAERLRAAGTPAERLRTYLESNLRFITLNAAHVGATQRILQNSTTVQVIEVEDAAAPLRRLLQSGQDSGEFGAFDPEITALSIRAAIDMAAFLFLRHPDLDVEHYISETVALFLRAVQPAPAPSASASASAP